MGALVDKKSHTSRKLLNQHLVGRRPECALRLSASYVSGHHALIRWGGSVWELVDQGSRNGTRVDGIQMVAGQPFPLKRGCVIMFGHAEETWTLVDVTEPEVMLLNLDDGSSIDADLGLIALPSVEQPEMTLYADVDGTWRLEQANGEVRELEDGEILESRGGRYRLCLPAANKPTKSVVSDQTAGPSPRLHFFVSSDEDFVELEVRYPHGRVQLGSRGHNYLLLTLARTYLADIAAGVAEPSSGWEDKDALGRALRMSPEQIDGEVHRVRKHLAKHGIREAAKVIERRPRTRQLRLGLRDVQIERR